MQRTDNGTETACARLRDMILGGAFEPGECLKQTDLSKMLGISRTPVRDILKRLEASGLIVFSGGNARVPALSLEDFEEVYRIRAVLEELAAQQAGPRLEQDDLRECVSLVRNMEEAVGLGDLVRWLAYDAEFHNRIYARCASPRLIRLIQTYWNATHHFRRIYCGLPGRIERAQRMHGQIMEAANRRDGMLLGVLTKAHIEESMRGILEAKGAGLILG